MCYAEVLLDVANRRFDQCYHYLIPENFELKIGMRVLVPLQNRRVQGLVVGLTDELPPELAALAIKPILEIVDKQSLLPPELIELAQWLAQTTLCPVAQSLHTVWPLLKGKMEEQVILLASPKDPDVQALRWLNEEGFHGLEVLARSRKKEIPRTLFLKRSGISEETLNFLVARSLVKIETRFLTPEAGKQPEIHPVEPVELTERTYDLMPEQDMAVKNVVSSLETGLPETILLHGVTGSGKTEVYRRLIAYVLAQGGEAILLVPEISLTAQVARYFQTCFGSSVIILHSGLSAKEKMQAWQEILNGNKRIVIGARSAVFAPLKNLRLIILDEEHDGAYKQDENPKYHAREVARKRMEQYGGVVLLGSATPSLEAFAAAKSGKIRLISMTRRVGKSTLPPVEIVDMRKELMQGNRSMFSRLLQQKLRERLELGEQAMLFLNRRGYSTFVVCRECGFVVSCPNCDVALTFHSQGQSMRCHYCDHKEQPPLHCPKCGSRYIRFFGQGTQRVEEELQGLFPEAKILRMDYDTTRSKESHEKILESFRRQKASVLVGTQMMAKGLDFPNVTLVGVVAADQMLNMPDFRAKERTFQLLTQVAGRAGRSVKPGEVVIQSYAPGDFVLAKAAHHDFEGFFWDEIRYRKTRKYPPFTHIIRVLLLHETEERVIKGAMGLGSSLQARMSAPEFGNTDLDILGPAQAVIARLKNQWRWQISVRGPRLAELREFLHVGIRDFFQSAASSGIILNIEVDPLNN